MGEHTDESEAAIECPGHGPMFRLYHPNDPTLLLKVYCRTCGKHPLDLLAEVRIPGSSDRGRTDG